jgi:NAD+ diphosphatase
MQSLYPYFTQNPLDRLDLIRADEKKVKKLKASKNNLYLIFDGNKIIINEQDKECFFSRDIIEEYNINEDEIILLGRYEDVNYFALTLKSEVSSSLSKVGIREFSSSLFIHEEKLGIIAQGASVLHWHTAHQYCSSCGKLTTVTKAGWRRDCLSCKREHFPRVDSVVIMLVTYEDYCLIGRGVNFLQDRYSCLAGYVESGETLEDASRRELYEEAGVIGLDVNYVLSQPWPFPSTLMVGMHVVAKAQELTLDYNELSDAKWVHKNDIKSILEGDESFGFSVPSKIAIARNLLELWVLNKI